MDVGAFEWLCHVKRLRTYTASVKSNKISQLQSRNLTGFAL